MIKRLLFILAFCIINIYAYAQSPKFEWRLENEKLTSPTTYQLDIYLYNLDTFDFKLGAGTVGMIADSAWRNGGTITITTIASELNPVQTGSALYVNQSNSFGARNADTWKKIFLSGYGSTCTIIPANKRVKCFSLVFTNTVAFSTTIPPKFAWKFDKEAGAGFNIMDSTGMINLPFLNYGSGAGSSYQAFCYTPSYWNGTQWITKSQLTGSDTAATLDKFHEVTIYNGTFSGSIDTRGYVLMPNATHNMGSADLLTVRANLDNYGTLNSNAASIEFKGNDIAGTDRTQYSATGFSVNNLTQKNPFNLELGGNTTVINKLDLSVGNVILKTSNLIIDNNASISGYSNNAFVQTDSVGVLQINNIGPSGRATNITFPVGNKASYSPASIVNTGTTDNFSVAVAPIVMDTMGVVISNAVNKTWYINDAQLGGSKLDINLQWNTADELPSFNRNICYVSSQDTSFLWSASTSGASAGSGPYTKGINSYNELSSKFLFGVGSGGKLNNGNLSGINNLENNASLLVFPNPSNGNFTIKLDVKHGSNTRISLLNLLGQEVWTETQSLKMGQQELGINTNLSEGVYILRLQNDTEQLLRNIVIKQ